MTCSSGWKTRVPLILCCKPSGHTLLLIAAILSFSFLIANFLYLSASAFSSNILLCLSSSSSCSLFSFSSFSYSSSSGVFSGTHSLSPSSHFFFYSASAKTSAGVSSALARDWWCWRCFLCFCNFLCFYFLSYLWECFFYLGASVSIVACEIESTAWPTSIGWYGSSFCSIWASGVSLYNSLLSFSSFFYWSFSFLAS